MKKIVSLLLMLCLLLPFAGALAELDGPIVLEPVELPSYLDVYYKDGQKFNVKDQDITIHIWADYNETNGGDMNDAWFTRYVKKHTGITLKWTMIPSSAVPEQLTLAMLSDELPDVFWGCRMSTATLLKYGDVEGQLIDLSPYITEEIMPALSYIFSLYPEKKAAITSPSGAIYSFPRLFSATLDTLNQGWLWDGWLQDNGYEMPKTLDELINVLYAFKAANPDSVPLGGAESQNDPRSYILNAFGFVNNATSNNAGGSPAIMDGKVVIPVMEDRYLDYLKLMNQFYNDGIINEEFFTMPQDAVKAQFSAQMVLYMGGRPTYYLPTEEPPEGLEWVKQYERYHSVYPLTSEWNETPAVQRPSSLVVGNLCVSADCKNPEIVCALLDWFFTTEGGSYMHVGAMKGEDTLDMYEGWYWSEEKQAFFDPDITSVENGGNGRWAAGGRYSMNGVVSNPTAWLMVGNRMGPLEYIHLAGSQSVDFRYSLSGMTTVIKPVDTWDYITDIEANADHVVEGYPFITWTNAEDQETLDEINAALTTYIESEVAKFIVGQRPLTDEEWASFQADLVRLGIEKRLDVYTRLYDGYLAALN